MHRASRAPRSAGAIFLGHLAEYLKLAITTAKPATLKKVKIDDGRLRIDNEKKLDLISS